MALKSILVVTSGSPPGEEARLKAAFALAEPHGADVAVLHVVPPPMVYAGGFGGEIPVSLIEAQQRENEQTAETIEAAVKAQATRAGVAVDWRREDGDLVGVAGIHARYSDLVVAAPDLARDLVFASAVPVLAFPEKAKPGVPKRVLIAWNGGREAARAVRDARPFLKAAQSVDVLVVDPPEGRPIGVDLARALGRHGIKVEVRQRLSGNTAVGAILLEEAKTSGADLLVMGAFGHSRLREWVLGGATEQALNEATIPLLLAH